MSETSNSPVRLCACFNRTTAEKIALLAQIYNKSLAHTVVMLVCVAFKYNYTSDIQYILCEPISPLPTITDSEIYSYKAYCKDNSFRYSCLVTFSNSCFSKIKKLMSLYSYQSYSETIRSLVETAFIYDYDEKLRFHKPTPIQYTSQPNNRNKQSSRQNQRDILLLDSF